MSEQTGAEGGVPASNQTGVRAGQPDLIEAYLLKVSEGYQAVLQQAEIIVRQRRQELAEAEAQLERVRQYDPDRRVASSPGPRSASAAGSSPDGRAARGAVQRRILDELARHPGGLTRGGLIEALGVKGMEKEETSITNALPGMSKTGKIRRKERGVYVVA